MPVSAMLMAAARRYASASSRVEHVHVSNAGDILEPYLRTDASSRSLSVPSASAPTSYWCIAWQLGLRTPGSMISVIFRQSGQDTGTHTPSQVAGYSSAIARRLVAKFRMRV
ncbi:hypothetical protein KCP69_10150 [Salmonella enterica subsp. enterica]|nr:hypothetical protein KCP69_10150 [Salmonella enterica subsp. enterica]